MSNNEKACNISVAGLMPQRRVPMRGGSMLEKGWNFQIVQRKGFVTHDNRL